MQSTDHPAPLESVRYLDLGGCSEHDVVWVLQTLLFALLRLSTDEQAEVSGQVAAQQRLVGGNVEQQSHRLHIEPRLQNLRRADPFRSGPMQERGSVPRHV